MKKIIPLVLAVFLLSVQAVSAAGIVEVEISAANPNQTAELGRHVLYNITVTNRMDNPDRFLVRFSGPRLEWRWPTRMDALLEPMESRTFTAEFVPMIAGEYVYGVEAVSQTNPAIKSATTIYLTAVEPPPVRINRLEATVNGNQLDTSLDVNVDKKKVLDIQYVIKDSKERVVKTESLSTEVTGADVIVKPISLDGVRAGDNSLEVRVSGLVKSAEFSLDAVRDVEETEEKIAGFGYEETVIRVTNKGNVVEKGYVVKRGIPKGDFATAFITKPANCLDGTNSQTCTFIIPEIEPGTGATISYRIEYWPSYSKIIAALFIITVLGVYYYKRISRPRILKRVTTSKGGTTHHVLLEIKAPKLKNLENVIVRDWVSPLAKVLHDEFAHAKPVTRRSDAGTELIWQLGRMAKKEERILSYKINTLIEGSLKMPRAYLRFRDKKGGRTRVYSRSIVIG